MNCEQIFDLLCLSSDGEASLEERQVVESHTSHCSDCAVTFASLQHTSSLLRTIELVEPPEYLQSAILSRTVHYVSPWEQVLQRASKFLRPAPIRMFAAAAGICAIAVIAYPRNFQRTEVARPQIAMVNSIPEGTSQSQQDIRSAILGPDYLAPTNFSVKVTSPSVSGGAFRTAMPRGVMSGAITTLAVLKTNVGVKPLVSFKKPATPLKSPLGKDLAPAKPEVGTTDPVSTTPTIPAVVVAATPVMPNDMVMMLKDMENGMKDNGMSSVEPMGGGHIILTSNVSYDNSDQIATLADLKRSLRNSNLDVQRSIEKSIKAREIRLPVFRGSF